MIFKNRDEQLKKISRLESVDTFWDIDTIAPPVREERVYERENTDLVVLRAQRQEPLALTEPIPKREDLTKTELL